MPIKDWKGTVTQEEASIFNAGHNLFERIVNNINDFLRDESIPLEARVVAAAGLWPQLQQAFELNPQTKKIISDYKERTDNPNGPLWDPTSTHITNGHLDGAHFEVNTDKGKVSLATGFRYLAD